jgi:O-antigen/teichoic acid export membrane protein
LVGKRNLNLIEIWRILANILPWNYWKEVLWDMNHIFERFKNRRFWRVSGLLMLANGIVLVFGILRLPILARFISKEEIGMIGMLGAVLPFVQLISLSGFDGASYHYVAKGYKDAFRVNVRIRLRWALLSSLVLFIFGTYWWLSSELILAWLFFITSITFPVTTGLSAVSGTLGAQEKFLHLFWFRIFEGLTRYSGVIVLILIPLLSHKVIWLYLTNKVALSLLFIGFAYWLIQQLLFTKAPEMSPEIHKEFINYGKHLTVLNGFSTIQTRLDALLISWFLPLSVIADYSIAQLVFTQVKRLWSVYYGVRYPPLVRLPIPQLRHRLIREAVIIWIGFLVLGVLVGVGLWFMIPIIFPPEYRTSLPFICGLLVVIIIGVPGGFAEMYFRIRQNNQRLYWLRLTAGIGGIIFPTILIFVWQGFGVVIGRILSNLLLSVLGIIFFIFDGQIKKN